MTQWMVKATVALLLVVNTSSAFAPAKTSSCRASRTELFGMNRKARRQEKLDGQNRSRPNTFYDAIKDSEDEEKYGKDTESMQRIKGGANVPEATKAPSKNKKTNLELEEAGERLPSEAGGVGESVTSGAKRVKLSDLGPEYRLAQMFPGVPPEVRAKYRFDNWSTIQVPEIMEKFKAAALVPVKSETTGETVMDFPPEPNVSDGAIDFVLANRDLLGFKFKKTLGRLKLRSQSQGNRDETWEARRLWKHFWTLENHISAPFRQMLLDGEKRVGPNFGNLDIKSYCGKDTYERAADYIVLKGMVAHWEKKVRDAEYVESTPRTRKNFMQILTTGDPKRYLPDPPILFTLNDVTRVCLMAQKMTAEFVNTPELFDDLPAEVRFIEKALAIKGGTALRRFMIEDFCPAEDITPAALREGLRRLDQQLENMQIDPYADMKNTVGRLCDAVAVGTDDARDPYEPYLVNFSQDGPGYFQTYTMDYDKESLVKFLDNAKRIEEGTAGPAGEIAKQVSKEFSSLFGLNRKPKKPVKTDKPVTYIPPARRACNRPHNLGWLDMFLVEEGLDDGKEDLGGKWDLSEVAGDEEEEEFEEDQWTEISKKTTLNE
eukprot:scaffold179885_cov57-Attheya_sp.AAC.4